MTTVNELLFFDSKPDALALFEAFREAVLEKVPDARIEVKKTQISFFDGVLDHSKSGGGHDRFYLGKEGHRKPMFLACSRAGWMCIYCDLSEKVILENNGFKCVQNTSNDDNYEYRAHVDFEDFDKFLKLVQEHLGR